MSTEQDESLRRQQALQDAHHNARATAAALQAAALGEADRYRREQLATAHAAAADLADALRSIRGVS